MIERQDREGLPFPSLPPCLPRGTEEGREGRKAAKRRTGGGGGGGEARQAYEASRARREAAR